MKAILIIGLLILVFWVVVPKIGNYVGNKVARATSRKYEPQSPPLEGLSAMELTTLGVEQFDRKNYASARQSFRTAADQGYAMAQFNLGLMYHRGDGVPQDNDQAMQWFCKAADQDFDQAHRAQYCVGALYLIGSGAQQDYQKARYWFNLAAGNGDEDAKKALSELPAQPPQPSEELMSAEESFKYHRTDAELGFDVAQYFVGLSYEKGEGVLQDYHEAMRWYRKAAEQGFMAAQFDLGALFEKGLGAPQDVKQARYWYELAAAQGHHEAKEALSDLPPI